MEEEIWRPVNGYEGIYEVSNMGRVKSLSRILMRSNGVRMRYKERIMKPEINRTGYECIMLYNGVNRVNKSIHTLVGIAFVANPENKPCIDHINGDRRDNRAENLRWCTIKENLNFELARKHNSEAKKGEKHPMFGKFGADNHRSKPVSQYTKDGVFIRKYGGLREAAREMGLWERNISAACRGLIKTSGGYIWKFDKKTER